MTEAEFRLALNDRGMVPASKNLVSGRRGEGLSEVIGGRHSLLVQFQEIC